MRRPSPSRQAVAMSSSRKHPREADEQEAASRDKRERNSTPGSRRLHFQVINLRIAYSSNAACGLAAMVNMTQARRPALFYLFWLPNEVYVQAPDRLRSALCSLQLVALMRSPRRASLPASRLTTSFTSRVQRS